MEPGEDAINERTRLRDLIRDSVGAGRTRTDLIRLVRARAYGQFNPRRLKDHKLHVFKVEKAITRSLAEGDIVEVPLDQPGCCKYVLGSGD